jgi:glycosyltransferase involved in cell wall biosynthesis
LLVLKLSKLGCNSELLRSELPPEDLINGMISIIIPTLNEEKYIGACLQSIKNQTSKTKYEIIVVDSDSTDKTKEIAKSMGALVINTEHKGVSASKNLGAASANGEILCFIDADCEAPDNHLEKIVKILENTGLDAIGGPCFYTDAGFLVRYATCNLNYFYFYHLLLGKLAGIISIAGGNMAVGKNVFDKVEGFNEQIKNVVVPEDLDFCTRLVKNGYKAAFIKDLALASSYRRHKGKISLDWLVRLIETIKIARSLRKSLFN